jgi:hypothetical protein
MRRWNGYNIEELPKRGWLPICFPVVGVTFTQPVWNRLREILTGAPGSRYAVESVFETPAPVSGPEIKEIILHIEDNRYAEEIKSLVNEFLSQEKS